LDQTLFLRANPCNKRESLTREQHGIPTVFLLISACLLICIRRVFLGSNLDLQNDAGFGKTCTILAFRLFASC
jgi:hypothetical protein